MTASMHWTARAACADRLDLPWTIDASGVGPWEAAAMRAVCSDCPVLLDCLNAVDDLDVTGGWWAGADRDPAALTAHLDPPAWAVADLAPVNRPDPVAASVACEWEPVTVGRARRSRRVVGYQARIPIGGVE